eukprot:689242-Hanusia_phi.AAC.1
MKHEGKSEEEEEEEEEEENLGVSGGGVGDEGHGLPAVLAEALNDFGWVGVEVVGNVGERDLARVEVLEGAVDLGERALEHLLRLLHHPRLVRVERVTLAGQELLLQLLLPLPSSVLDRQTDVGAVAARGVGEDAGGCISQGDAEFLRLLLGVLAHEVHLERLVRLSRHLDAAVEEVHLVDEEVAEDTRAGDDHVDAGPAELLERDELQLVHAAERVGDGTDTYELQNLRERLAVRLDVVSAPQGKGDRLGVGAAVVSRQPLQQTVHHNLGAVNGSRGRDGLRVERVHVLAGRQHVRVADGIAARAREDVLAVEGPDEAPELVVSHYLLQAELEVLEERRHGRVLDVEAPARQRLAPGSAAGDGVEDRSHGVNRLHPAVDVGRALDQGPHGLAHSLSDLLVERHVSKHVVVVVAVDVLDVAPAALREDARKRLDSILRAVDGGDVDERGHRLLGGRRHSDGVEAAGEEARLDLHEAAVDGANDRVALVERELLRVLLLRREVGDVLVKVARASSRDDGVDDGGAAGLILAEALVGGDELAELLETLVEPRVLSRRRQVRDGGGVAPALGDGGLRGVVGRIVVDVGHRVDEAVGVAGAGHADLLAGHELERPVGSEVEHSVGAEDALEVGVVGGEAVVGGGALGEEEAHGVTLVPERGLDADEHVAELLAVHQEVLTVRVELTGRLAPVLLQLAGVGGELLVLVDGHAVLDIEVGGADASLLVVEHSIDELLRRLGEVAEVVALADQLLAHREDGGEDVKVGGSADVALVWRKGEDGDGELLVLVLLDAQVRPLDRALGEERDAVRKGNGASGEPVASSIDDGLDGSVDLGEGNLQGNLDGMKPELRRLPLLEGLEDEGDGAEVGAVELGERLHRLVVILRRRATDEGEAGEVDDGVGDDGAVGEELVDGAGEVETSRVDAHDAAAAGLELLDEGGVVTLVLSVDVRLLQNDADRRRLLGVDADSAGVLLVVPPVVLGGVLEDLRGKGMPDADVGEEDGGSDLLLLHHLSVIDVGVGHVEKHRLEVLGRPTQPVLEGEHEGPRVLRLVRRQELEHLGEGAEKLEHGALERRSVLLRCIETRSCSRHTSPSSSSS